MSYFKNLKEDIKCIQERDPAARGFMEIIFNYPGLHAVAAYRLANWLWRKKWFFLARFISSIFRWLTLIEIHPAATIGKRFFIDHGAGVVIGATTEIGDDCTLYQGVTLGGTSLVDEKRHPTLKNGVIVGAGAKVLGPIVLGNDSRVGSNSVVLQDVPDGATVVGVAARLVTSEKRAKQSKAKLAEKLSFSAYGVDQNHPNPEAEAINLLVDRLSNLEKQLNEKKSSPNQSKSATKSTKTVEKTTQMKNKTTAKTTKKTTNSKPKPRKSSK